MALQQTYERFLAAPTASALDPSVGLHYITTTISVNSADAVVKHFTSEQKKLSRRVEKVLSCADAGNSLVLEVETEIEFKSSGGSYLPDLDAEFVADHIVTFPIIHFVAFKDGLIRQVRQFWDMSSLLKQIGVIGRSGRNWPIKEGKDQIKLIAKSLSEFTVPASAPASNGRATPTEERPPAAVNGKGGRTPSAKTLDLGDTNGSPERVRPPRQESAYKPPARNLQDIIGEPDSPTAHRHVVSPPKGRNPNANYQTFNLGDGEDEDDKPVSRPVSKGKTLDPKKYAHFDFGHGEDTPQKPEKERPMSTYHAKQSTSWNFEDFATPEKKPVKYRKNDLRNFTWSDDEAEDKPVKPKEKPKARKDAETHFAFKDTPDTPAAVLGNVTNKGRNDNQSQFEIADDSPVAHKVKKELPADRKAAVKMMGSNWNNTDDGEDDGGDFFAGMSGEAKTRGITIAGNGMGKLKNWESAEIKPKGITIAGNGMGKLKDWESGEIEPKGITVAGNGMGMRKGVDKNERSWGYDDTPPASVKKENKPVSNASLENQRPAARSGRSSYVSQTQPSADFQF